MSYQAQAVNTAGETVKIGPVTRTLLAATNGAVAHKVDAEIVDLATGEVVKTVKAELTHEESMELFEQTTKALEFARPRTDARRRGKSVKW